MKTDVKAIKTKRCRGCERVRPITEFHKDRTRCDGYKAQCADCRDKKRDNRIAIRKEERERTSFVEQRKAQARRVALKRLVALHEREFVRLASEEYRRLDVPATWQAITDESVSA